MTNPVLRPKDKLIINRDCTGYSDDREIVLLNKGDNVTLVCIQRVLVRMGESTLSVDAENIGLPA